MSMNNDTIRLRVYPSAESKEVPRPRHHWPEGSVIYHSFLDAKGSLLIGCALEFVGEWAFREYLVVPGTVVSDEVRAYCFTHRANVLVGCRDDLTALPIGPVKVSGKSGGFGYELRGRGYRAGWAIVSADMPRQLMGIAEHWSESHKWPGHWSIVLAGLGEWVEEFGTRRHRKYFDAPRINLKVFGDHVLTSWGSTRRNDHLDVNGEERRPANRSGPFVDVLSAASALAGGPVRDLTHACQLFDIEPAAPRSNVIDRLRAETVTVAQLYHRQRTMIDELDLGIDHSTLVSTGGIATALLREMEATP